MPIFDFVCHKCETIQERLVKNLDAVTEQKCEECSGELIKSDVPSKTSFVLKGKWYKTTKSY